MDVETLDEQMPKFCLMMKKVRVERLAYYDQERTWQDEGFTFHEDGMFFTQEERVCHELNVMAGYIPSLSQNFLRRPHISDEAWGLLLVMLDAFYAFREFLEKREDAFFAGRVGVENEKA